MRQAEPPTDRDEFVSIVKMVIRDTAIAAVTDSLRHPPGRKPPELLQALSDWANGLMRNDRDRIEAIVGEAVDRAIFDLLCYFDIAQRVKAVKAEGELQLILKAGGKRTLLNDPVGKGLAETFRFLTRSTTGMMPLCDAVAALNDYDGDLTIYAKKPWAADSAAIVEAEGDDRSLTRFRLDVPFDYFLEVAEAVDFLQGWTSQFETSPSAAQQCQRLIEYAVEGS